ncbi:2Fe-2S iron-sulfur cluster-binding protein [Chelatococcus asaccharovorans]|uniref:2Fe-2S ferredoxin n=2 Tax=Chelatococcus asaccharovorans TaxID=28210 RepID=A0A2V3UA09_9HYPH|nr:2Fe-2S iron-sulfur cluster binding domain-containing protein [Chelatococcus asaccharovorans]PXW60104.1 2Fe-2S ferredoxin [Chelatococcus asaccharovorans]
MKQTITVTWLCADGASVTAEVPLGHSLMEAAVAHNVPGVIGDCGGALACATCHVVVESAPIPLPMPSATEGEMLEFTEAPAEPSSRLSCQIKAVPELNGLILRVPGP